MGVPYERTRVWKRVEYVWKTAVCGVLAPCVEVAVFAARARV